MTLPQTCDRLRDIVQVSPEFDSGFVEEIRSSGSTPRELGQLGDFLIGQKARSFFPPAALQSTVFIARRCFFGRDEVAAYTILAPAWSSSISLSYEYRGLVPAVLIHEALHARQRARRRCYHEFVGPEFEFELRVVEVIAGVFHGGQRNDS